MTVPDAQTGAAADERLPTWPQAAAPGTVAGGSTAACVVLGLFFGAVAVYMLILDPSAAVDTSGFASLGSEYTRALSDLKVVNLQKLAIGQTFGVASAVFFAAALRPR